MSGRHLERTASELRRSFDETFAKPAAEHSSERREGLLKLRAGDALLVARPREMAGVMRCPRVTALPATHPALLGLGSVRGQLVALYSVATLLRASPVPLEGGWIMVCGGQRDVGLVFDEVQGHAHISTDALAAAERASERMSAPLLHVDGERRTLLRLSTILTELRATSRRRESHKE